ncbi:MAG: ABC transporter ATP-binding protein [Candidatus Brocadiia bacterium]
MSAETASQTILSVQSVTKIYKMGEVDVPALRDASVDIRDGEFLTVVGPSGSGKSTLLNIIGGMDRPTSGTVAFEGRDLTRLSDRRLTLYRRRQVGFIFQFYNLVPTLTALENVQVAVEIVSQPMEPIEALRLVGLEERAGHFPSQLSGGEQQRVAIARALASNPRLLLCDEPTGSVDLDTGRQVLGLLVELNRQLAKTVVLITHNRAIAAIGHRIATLRDGVITEVRENESPTPVEQVQW